MTVVEITGFVAAFLTAICWFPQAFRTIRTGDVSSISLTAQVTFAVGVSVWLAYGIMIRSGPIIVCQVVTLIPVLVIIFIKGRNVLRG